MPNYSLNNSVPEPDRSLEDKGFNGPSVTNPPTAYETGAFGPPPNQLTSPLTNEVNESSNTETKGLGPAAGDFARRGY